MRILMLIFVSFNNKLTSTLANLVCSVLVCHCKHSQRVMLIMPARGQYNTVTSNKLNPQTELQFG